MAPESIRSDPPPSLSPWRPLRIPLFRDLLVADLVSDIGTFMQTVGAAWLMTTLTSSSLYVALIQTASALPFFLLALPAGSIGDIFNRRKLILGTEIWMLAIALVLAVVTFIGAMTPWLLLLLTLALSLGDAIESPTWRAIFPDLVKKDDLTPALALNGIEFNLARAVGPGLAGLIIAAVGVATAFLLDALSFLGVIFVIFKWKSPARKSTLPAETLGGASAAAIRYVRYSPGIRALLLRSGIVIFFASSFSALLPAVAKELSKSALGYGFLLGFFGVGAVFGAVVLQRFRSKLSTETLLSCATAIFGATLLSTAGLAQSRAAVRPNASRRWFLDGIDVSFQYNRSESGARLGSSASAGSLSFRISRQRGNWQRPLGLHSGAHKCAHGPLYFRDWNGRLTTLAICYSASQHGD